MKVVTAAEMREIDRKTIEKFGVPGLVLMERAGLAVVSKIKEAFGRKNIIVISGAGNNGGDGLVIARNLHNEGWDVKVFLAAKPEELKGDSLSQYNAAVKSGVHIMPMEEIFVHRTSGFGRHSLIVDAIFGTGLNTEISGTLSEAVNLLNNSRLPTVSVDIPSGISSDNGQVMGTAVRADYTITFGLPKRGHLLFPGAEFSGKLFIEDIGFPPDLMGSEKIKVELLDKSDVSALIPGRPRYSHKGNYGHVFIVAGSRGKTGAAFMAAKACLRSGAGLVTLGVPESMAGMFQSRVTEEMTLILPDKGDGTLSGKASDMILDFLHEKADLLAVGPGLGVTADIKKLLRNLIKHSTKPLLIDADGINSINGDTGIFVKSKAPVVLTPHPGEMAGLCMDEGLTVKDIEKDRIQAAMRFAEETGTFLVLKGVPSVIAAPDGRAFINPTGNPGMATGRNRGRACRNYFRIAGTESQSA